MKAPFRPECLVLVLLAQPSSLSAQDVQTVFPPVRGTREMAAAGNSFEVEAAYRLLLQGGNAVDAGVAAVLAAAVTEQSRFGLGGEMPLLVKMRGQKVDAISGVGMAPTGATVEFYRNRSPEPWEEDKEVPPIPAVGILGAITPGAFDGLILALDRYGTRSFAQVAAPAIEYAEGFPIPEEFARFIGRDMDILKLWPDAARFHFPDGVPPKPGQLVRYKNLARTLSDLVAAERRRGSRSRKLRAVRDEFYKGEIARKIAKFSEQNGGLIRYEDLAGFSAEVDEPATSTYRGYSIHKPGFWSQGPVLIQALNILEGYDLKAMGHNSADYLHTVTEALKLAMADRDRYYGDPKFSEIPAEKLLSKEYAAERRKLIDPGQASIEHRPGTLLPALDLTSHDAAAAQARVWVSDTTCVNVVDRDRNVFSATPSGAWLPAVIVGDTGIPLTTRLQSFVLTAGHPNILEPGKRPRITLSPTIVEKDGRPFLALSTPGGDNQDQALLQVLLNILDFGMDPQVAVEAPRIQSSHFYASFGLHEFTPGQLSVENRIPEEVSNELSRRGHRVDVRGPWSNPSAPTVIQIENDVLSGGADPRRARYVFGR